ncbi:hypothetical protein CEXT_598041 [Caerostris extrusa]|uniref:Uncharacterized protein n=1 Tax=Caerostris extrusa TaxID=172846 RepID=A0AAV4NQI6_CAEEX|nr:hypothetical protein CEXT_598041 [Caerostris extrusa]
MTIKVTNILKGELHGREKLTSGFRVYLDGEGMSWVFFDKDGTFSKDSARIFRSEWERESIKAALKRIVEKIPEITTAEISMFTAWTVTVKIFVFPL